MTAVLIVYALALATVPAFAALDVPPEVIRWVFDLAGRTVDALRPRPEGGAARKP